jgi:osmotically-inducible protein OsmY
MLKVNQRQDHLIINDIKRIIFSYPPANNDRNHIMFHVVDGVVHLSGYVRTEPTATYLVHRIGQIEGILGLVTDHLYTDEGLRLEIGRLVPFGVQVRVEYGNVILAGYPVDEIDIEQVLAKVSQVPGVLRVVNAIS